MPTAETTQSSVSSKETWRPSVNPWLVAVLVAMAAFMEVLDTSIANVALPHIAGNLGASNDESTWILTSYLVSNAIVLPITGWFAGIFGRKRFFMICLAIFTLSSLLCGAAPSLGAIILFRVLQGAGGGGLQPMAQAILADTFPPEKRGLAFALFGITTVIAPTIGPTLGGWITDNYSWRWIFFINLPVGILALFLIFRLLDDPPWAKRIEGGGITIDYIGLALLVIGVGALQIMLDKGQEEECFGSTFILWLAIIAVVGLTSLVIWEWFQKTPIVDVRLYTNMNFLGASFMMFMMGVMLFASLVMMPQFLQTLIGYTAESAGLVLSGGGVLLLFLMPIVGALTSRVQARHLIAFGWLALSIAMFYATQTLSLQITFQAAALLRATQAFGLGCLFVPITLVSYIGMSPEKSGNVAGLVNFMRNIGASIGTSLVTTVIARRAQARQVDLVAHATLGQLPFVQTVDAMSRRLAISGLDASRAAQQAQARVYNALVRQATALAYIDAFWILCVGAGIMFLLSFVLKRNEPGGGRQVALE